MTVASAVVALLVLLPALVLLALLGDPEEP